MKQRRGNRTIHSLLFLLIAFFSNAQDRTTVHATVDKNSILIGEQINLVLEADIPENDPIGFFSVDSIAHFEFLLKGKIDTTNTNKGTVLKQLFRITSFDSGRFVIPSYHLPQSEDLKTDSIIIHVGYMPMDTTKDYNDIKEIIEVEGKKKIDWTWYYVGGAALLALILLYLLTRKKKKKKEEVLANEETVDPYTEALGKLEELKKENLPATDETKLYYSRLTDIFRVYVEKRKGIHSLQQTTDDLVRQLKNINLGKEQYDQLSQALRQSDFVKFAKYIPTATDNVTVFDVIRKSIESIEKLSPVSSVKEV
ncbi:MAG: LPXTG cell wall anchor domain-containing protein [Bacteroidetes bacterium]|nr:LPXTG cell wall anchor domain-containing protein [Bacteroidota bacterium]